MDKVFSAIEDQIKKLDSRGLDVTDFGVTSILEKENYYNVVNGYKELFIDKTHTGPNEKYGHDNYLKNSNFDVKIKHLERKTATQKRRAKMRLTCGGFT